jgi:hypothetical protein
MGEKKQRYIYNIYIFIYCLERGRERERLLFLTVACVLFHANIMCTIF